MNLLTAVTARRDAETKLDSEFKGLMTEAVGITELGERLQRAPAWTRQERATEQSKKYSIKQNTVGEHQKYSVFVTRSFFLPEGNTSLFGQLQPHEYFRPVRKKLVWPILISP